MLDTEFYALSNSVIFNGCHQVKIRDFSENTRYKSSFHEYLLSVFAYIAVLILSLVVLDVEFYALFDGLTLNGGH